jgi:hypothetical protein
MIRRFYAEIGFSTLNGNLSDELTHVSLLILGISSGAISLPADTPRIAVRDYPAHRLVEDV